VTSNGYRTASCTDFLRGRVETSSSMTIRLSPRKLLDRRSRAVQFVNNPVNVRSSYSLCRRHWSAMSKRWDALEDRDTHVEIHPFRQGLSQSPLIDALSHATLATQTFDVHGRSEMGLPSGTTPGAVDVGRLDGDWYSSNATTKSLTAAFHCLCPTARSSQGVSNMSGNFDCRIKHDFLIQFSRVAS